MGLYRGSNFYILPGVWVPNGGSLCQDSSSWDGSPNRRVKFDQLGLGFRGLGV